METKSKTVMRPASFGQVRLQSKDPLVPPAIDYNLLANAADRRRMLEGVKIARRIGQVSPLADLIDHEMTPGTNITSDKVLAATIEGDLDTYHHGSGTVPMGGDDDRSAVVDAIGRVRGFRGLRVVDASIFPEIPSTPTNLTTIMLAEHIAHTFLSA